MNVIQELHQFEDGLRPAQPSLAHAWNGGRWVLDADAVAVLEQQETERLYAKVDAAVDRVRIALAGDPLKAMEYAKAAVDAQAFKDEGYPKKSVPPAVSAWVVKGRTARQAADQILQEAARFNHSLLTLRSLRLKAKEQIKAHVTQGRMDMARSAAETAIHIIGETISG